MWQAAIAQQGWPFTACQPNLLHETLTKSPQMWGSHNEMKATQRLQISTVQACTEGQADLSTQTPTCLCLPPSSCPPVCVQRDRSWPVRLSVTLMSLLSCVQMLSSHLPVTLSSYKEILHTHQLFYL